MGSIRVQRSQLAKTPYTQECLECSAHGGDGGEATLPRESSFITDVVPPTPPTRYGRRLKSPLRFAMPITRRATWITRSRTWPTRLATLHHLPDTIFFPELVLYCYCTPAHSSPDR